MQCLRNKNLSSSWQNVLSGLPKGMVQCFFPSPNKDLPLSTNETYVDICTDDTTLHITNKDCKTVVENIQTGAGSFKTSCLINKMYINR